MPASVRRTGNPSPSKPVGPVEIASTGRSVSPSPAAFTRGRTSVSAETAAIRITLLKTVADATALGTSPSGRLFLHIHPQARGREMPLYGKEHIERYEATDGADGYDWVNGTTILLLHTKGRKSGREYTHALIFRELDGAYLIVASKGGAPEPPEWFLNLQAEPTVTVQIKGEKFTAHARVATPEEKPKMWRLMAEAWPDYDEYQKKTDREIPIVVLERA